MIDTDDDTPIQAKRDRTKENDLYQVMRTAEGRAVLWWIINEGGLTTTSFRGENPLTAAFAAGKREVSLKLWDYMRRVDLGLVRIMEDEAIVRDNAQKGRT